MYAILRMLPLRSDARGLPPAITAIPLSAARRPHHHASVGVSCMPAPESYASLVPVGSFFTFQPSELAKPALVLFLAYFLQTRITPWTTGKGPSCARPASRRLYMLILKERIGHALVCAAVAMACFYLAGCS